MRHRRLLLALAPVVGLSLASSSSRADSVDGTRGGEQLAETRDTIALTMDHGHATLVVRRTFHNTGIKFDQAVLSIDTFPAGTAATGLRTQGIKDGVPVWFDGVLMEAEQAAAKYQELTGIGGFYPKDPALLSWRHGIFMLQVFPIDPGGSKTVEYTLEAPTKYLEGRDVLELPRMGVDDVRPMVTIEAANKGDALFVGDGELAAGTTFPLAEKGVTISVARSPESQPKLGGAYTDVFFGAGSKGRALMHTAIEIAPRLSEIPKNAWVVVALDASKSMSVEQRDAEITAARAYLASMTDARVKVMLFSRKTRALTEKFVSSADAAKELAKLTLGGENGSALDAALVDAAAQLEKSAPKDAARRIVVVTDFRTRVALEPSTLKLVTKSSGAIVHLASIGAGNPAVSRDDDDPWAAPARATGGVLWHASAPRKDATLALSAPVFEEWARPLRVDRLEVKGVGIDGDLLGVPPSMAEGEGFDDLRFVKYAPPALALSGELWSMPVKTMLEPDDVQRRLWSALVFGSPLLDELTEPEMMVLAMKGHAVSPVTSFLAIEPGVRPSTEGLDETEAFGLGSLGLIGHGGGGAGCGIGLGSFSDAKYVAWLRNAMSSALGVCGASDRKAKLHFETTSREIVDVRLTELTGKKSAAIEACLEEQAWSLDLPALFDREWAVYDVRIAPK